MPFALKESAGGWNVHRCFVSLYSTQSEIVKFGGTAALVSILPG